MDQNPSKEPRSPVNLRIKFRSESLDQFIDRYAIDVSRGGIFIRTREPLAVGTQLKLDFQYQNGSPLMSGEGTVVWIRDPDPNRANVPPGMGVRFDRLTPESQSVLDQLLNDKASREKGGAGMGAGLSAGMAVRRPSSMFAALEADQLGQMPAQPSSSSGGAAPPGPGASTFPGRPSAAYIPTVSALGLAGVKSATVVPSAAPPAQPRMTSSSLAAATGAGAKASPPPAQSTTVKAPASGTAADAKSSSGDTTVVAAPPLGPGAFRPLGSARNPFSGAGQAGKPAAPTLGRLTSTLARIHEEKPSGPFTLDTATPATGIAIAPEEDAGGELTDEPTQIAGRMPSFMNSDEDPTSVGGRPGSHAPSESSFLGGDPNDEPTRITSRDMERDRGGEPELRSLAGGRGGAARPVLGAEGGRVKQSLDLAPPVGSAAPLPPLGDLRNTSQQLGTSSTTSIGGARVDQPDAGLDPLSVLDAIVGSGPTASPPSGGPVSGTAPTLLSSAPAMEGASLGAAAVNRVPSTPSIAPVPTPGASAATGRRPSPALIGLTVIGLGAAAFFVFRYFASQSTQTANPPAVAVAIAPAGSPEGTTLPTEPKGTGEVPPMGTGEAAPAGAKTGAAPVPGPAEPAGGRVAPTPTPTGKKPGGDTTATSDGARTATVVDSAAAAARRNLKRKLAVRGGGSGADVAPPEPAEKPVDPKVASAAAAAADAPAEPEPPSEATAGHQIRVTSKPPGADVAIDGQVVGQTPLSTNIADVSSPHFLSVRKDGFETFEQMVSATSAWVKTKAAKGQTAVPTLKINAKLKPSAGGAAPVEVKAGPADGKAPAGGEPAAAAPKEAPTAPTTPPKVDEAKADHTLAPGAVEDRAPTSP